MPDVLRCYEFKHVLGRRVELPELVPEVVRVGLTSFWASATKMSARSAFELEPPIFLLLRVDLSTRVGFQGSSWRFGPP